MTKEYGVCEVDENLWEVWNQKGQIIFSSRTQQVPDSICVLLNHRFDAKYDINYHLDSNGEIYETTIYCDGVFVIDINENRVRRSDETQGYSLFAHLNRKH